MNSNVASILLNYNSNNDLYLAIEDLSNQINVQQIIIIVDNNSSQESRKELVNWQKKEYSDAISGGPKEIKSKICEGQRSKIIFIYNDKNVGYSAGNNIGIRSAKQLGVDNIFIINPDMRVHDENYLSKLLKHSESDNQVAITASRIIGVDGKDQSPMVPDDFWRELLWPKQLLPNLFKQPEFIQTVEGIEPTYVSKVVGCAMLIKMDFLESIDFLDESTFLYSEEAILSAQAGINNRKLQFIPSLIAYHMHYKEKKESTSFRMLLSINSRIYYVSKYSNYTTFQKRCVIFSLKLLRGIHRFKSRWLRVK